MKLKFLAPLIFALLLAAGSAVAQERTQNLGAGFLARQRGEFTLVHFPARCYIVQGLKEEGERFRKCISEGFKRKFGPKAKIEQYALYPLYEESDGEGPVVGVVFEKRLPGRISD